MVRGDFNPWHHFFLVDLFLLINLACCEASNSTHFTLTIKYNRSITKWSMKGFTFASQFPPVHCHHSNKAWINLVFSETTQEITFRFDHLLCSIPPFPLCQSSVEMIWEKWITFLIPGFSKCNVKGNRDDYHLDARLIFCSTELRKDMHTISQDKNTTLGFRAGVLNLFGRFAYSLSGRHT